VLLVFLLEDYLALQVMAFIFTNILQMIYLINWKPLNEGYRMEIFNEGTTLFLSYFMIVYTDFNPSQNNKIDFGPVFVGIFQANIIINILVIIVLNFKIGFLKIRRWFRLRRLKKRTLALQPSMNSNED
jgi:fumarate reductase subunit C